MRSPDSHPELPLDPDLEVAETALGQPLPVHLAPGNLALVAAGGAVGTGLRYALSTTVPDWAGVPVGVVGINVVGAFLLGLLLELLAEVSIDAGWSRRARLGLGTGVLGGFTTYSTLAADTATLAGGHPGPAVGYALTTVLLGAAASTAGVWLSRRQLRPALAEAVKPR